MLCDAVQFDAIGAFKDLFWPMRSWGGARQFDRALLEQPLARYFRIVLFLVLYRQTKPHLRHLDVDGACLFILGSACKFQARAREAAVIV